MLASQEWRLEEMPDLVEEDDEGEDEDEDGRMLGGGSWIRKPGFGTLSDPSPPLVVRKGHATGVGSRVHHKILPDDLMQQVRDIWAPPDMQDVDEYKESEWSRDVVEFQQGM
jgi:hypothetical protein